MKIVASKKDDILRRKAQYESDLAAYNERQEGYRKAYDKAEDAVLNPIKEYLEKKLSRYSALQFEIQVSRAFMGRDNRGSRIWIRCNERNKFDEDVALAWSYDVELTPSGEVSRKTSSWSGLSATTEAQMNSLRQTVSALDWLNDVDWTEFVDIDMPKYEDYYDVEDKRPTAEDFDAQLQEAELEELVGSNKVIKVKNWGESCPYRGDVWLKLVRETPSMYSAIIIPNYAIAGPEDISNQLADGRFGEYRVRKSSVRPVEPLTIQEV